jgi:hypothetical protein
MHNSDPQPALRFLIDSELGVHWFSSVRDAASEVAHQLHTGTPFIGLDASGQGSIRLEQLEQFKQEIALRLFP